MKGVERLETLVSISTDGRVLEWNLKKGLVMSTLMQLKKSGTVSFYYYAMNHTSRCYATFFAQIRVKVGFPIHRRAYV